MGSKPGFALLVDDDVSALQPLALMLESNGLHCRVVTTIADAWEELKASTPLVLVADLLIPSGTESSSVDSNPGLSFVEAVLRAKPGLPVACLSVMDDAKVHSSLAALGVTYLRKGIDSLAVIASSIHALATVDQPEGGTRQGVVLVEHDEFYALQLSELLSDHGVQATVVRSAEGAIGHDFSAATGVVIRDSLPNNPAESGITIEESRGNFLSGIAVARRLRQRHPDLPIVMLSSDVAGGQSYEWAVSNRVPCVARSAGPKPVLAVLSKLGVVPKLKLRSFIVHGHDEAALHELKDYLQNTLHWAEPIVLRQEPSGGKTLIEKFESYAFVVDYVFVLLTPDDRVFAATTNEDKRRARQNVIFELGFFYGLFGRSSRRVLVLHKGPVELPSDISGVVWIDISAGVLAAGERIRRELGLT